MVITSHLNNYSKTIHDSICTTRHFISINCTEKIPLFVIDSYVSLLYFSLSTKCTAWQLSICGHVMNSLLVLKYANLRGKVYTFFFFLFLAWGDCCEVVGLNFDLLQGVVYEMVREVMKNLLLPCKMPQGVLALVA